MAWILDHKRQIFQGVVIGCSIATPILTVYCTKKAIDKVNEKGVTSRKDIAKTVLPYAIAPVTTTVIGTVASCFVYNEGTKALNLASTTGSALTALTATNKIYDEVVKEVAGDKKYGEIQKKVLDKIADTPAKDKIKDAKVEIVEDEDKLTILGPTEIVCDTGKGDVLFREKWSNQLIRTSWEAIRKDINDLLELKNDRGFDITVNDLLIKLGANSTELGDMYYFPNGIKYIADDEHLYTRDPKTNGPLGILEFAMGYNPVPVTKPLARI